MNGPVPGAGSYIAKLVQLGRGATGLVSSTTRPPPKNGLCCIARLLVSATPHLAASASFPYSDLRLLAIEAQPGLVLGGPESVRAVCFTAAAAKKQDLTTNFAASCLDEHPRHPSIVQCPRAGSGNSGCPSTPGPGAPDRWSR